jgi:hypothetical protein
MCTTDFVLTLGGFKSDVRVAKQSHIEDASHNTDIIMDGMTYHVISLFFHSQ